MSKQLNEVAERQRTSEREAVELRQELQGVMRGLDRVSARFASGNVLRSSQDADRLIRLCELIGDLEGIDLALSGLSPVKSLPYRASIRLVADLKRDMARTLNASAAVRQVAGASADPYITARRVLYFSLATTPRRKGDGSKGIAADLLGDNGKARKTVASAPVAIRALRTKAADGTPRVLATASSTAVDLEGDVFDIAALKQMRTHFAKGALIFLNHQYRVPVDIFGVTESAKLTKRGDRTDLDLVIRVETGNPLAVQAFDYIRGGTTLGVSVGVLVNESERLKGGKGVRIIDCTPLEASLVGIPANQTAWTQGARS